MSFLPANTATPLWSASVLAGLPALIAGLPQFNAIVLVGPPLSAKRLNMASTGAAVVPKTLPIPAAIPEPVLFPIRLYSEGLEAEPLILLMSGEVPEVAVLPATIVLLIKRLEPAVIPPPLVAVFPLTVLLVILSMPPA